MRPAMHTVLVVDDSAIDRRLASGLLERDGGYQILLATCGKDALVALKAQPIDLVLTDLQMDEMDGLELVEAVRADFPLTPVILMTALGSEESELTSPFPPAESPPTSHPKCAQSPQPTPARQPPGRLPKSPD